VRIILINILFAIIVLLVIFIVVVIDYPKRKNRELFYHVIVKFVGGNKTKLVLNAEQYEQLQATLNQKDGFFEIGDDLDNVKFYREHVCAVEMKKK
jgi:hypothetical protein